MADQTEKQPVDPSHGAEDTAQPHDKSSAQDAEKPVEAVSSTDTGAEQTKLRLFLITVALMASTFLVALDTNILATAIPQITSEFSSLDHVSWYGAAYALTKMVFQPAFGRLCTLFPLKTVFYIANAFLIIGSIICATAPSSEVLILGRAVQGWGGAGIFSTIMTMTVFVISKRTMPVFISLLSSMYIVASIVGPVIGGVFAGSSVTWRFCFWINLPIAAVTLVLTFFFVPEPKRDLLDQPLREKLMRLDPLGTCILTGSITSLILALQWGGTSLPWSNGQVWGCLLCAIVTMAIFIGYQVKQKEDALIPMRIVTQRTVAACCVAVCFLIMSINVPIYYLPFYFQASLGLSTTTSGLYILPLAAFNPIASMASGTAVTKTGIYVPWMLASGALAAIGYGLLSTLTLDSNLGEILGYQIIASIGFGLGIQMPFTAMRNVLNDADIPIANALIVFFQGLGSSLSLSIGQNIFLNTLQRLLRADLPPSEVEEISHLGAGDVNSDHISEESLPIVARAYNRSMATTMYFAVIAAAIAFLGACLVEWKRVDLKKKGDTESTPIKNEATENDGVVLPTEAKEDKVSS